ncbi:MAG: hypothetical protein CFH19_01262 [Alphaproteobacteria bacterium MarineAlpha5_Bin9]|nr:MAG: hypothetical protein CFH19_01262 [Alphaproteobacteria bacterium MarineAlpha5_Bin9]
MKKYLIIIFLLCLSCSYPDIDTVPEFEKMEISEDS